MASATNPDCFKEYTRGEQVPADNVDVHHAKHIALFIPSLTGGGIPRVTLHLAEAFANRGYRVDLVLCQAAGPYQDQVPAGVKIVVLKPTFGWWARVRVLTVDPKGLRALLRPVLLPYKAGSTLPYLSDLVLYLRQEHPAVVLSAKTHTNLLALWARRLAGVSTQIVISEHLTLSYKIQGPKKRKWRWRFILPLVQRTYQWADAIVAVSKGTAHDLSQCVNLPIQCITSIYNPVVHPTIINKANTPLEHPWFTPGAPPVILGAGRLVPPKGFSTLLRAFARVRAMRPARLLILGEGRDRVTLERLAFKLGITEDVSLPGFAANPYVYMARSSVFVLASASEGFGNVLAEAMACGCPVVSTDCPNGPAEILDNGKYGPLVPVGDDALLAKAMLEVLDNPPDPDWLRMRAEAFSVDHATDLYLELLLGSEIAGLSII